MKIAVIGIGNVLFCDEGVGVYAAAFLQHNYSFAPSIDIVDGGTLGFKLMNFYQEYDRVIIIDTVSIDDTPGSIYNLPADALLGLGKYRNTAHEVEVVEMLEICSLLPKHAQVNVIGIVPEDIESVKIDLTPTIKQNFHHLIQTVIAQLQKENIAATPKEGISLEEILHHYNNPTMKLANGIEANL